MGDTQEARTMSGQRPTLIAQTGHIPYEEHTQVIRASTYTITPEEGSTAEVVGRIDFARATPVLVPFKDIVLEDFLLMLDQPETTDTMATCRLVKAPAGVDPVNPASGDEDLVVGVTGYCVFSTFVPYTPRSICTRTALGDVEGWVTGAGGAVGGTGKIPTENIVKAGEVLWFVWSAEGVDGTLHDPTMMSLTHRFTQIKH